MRKPRVLRFLGPPPPDDHTSTYEPQVRIGKRAVRFGPSGKPDHRVFTLLFLLARQGVVARDAEVLVGLRGWILTPDACRTILGRVVKALAKPEWLRGRRLVAGAHEGYTLDAEVEVAPELAPSLARWVGLDPPLKLFGRAPEGTTWRRCDAKQSPTATPMDPLEAELVSAPDLAEPLYACAAWIRASHTARKSPGRLTATSVRRHLFEAYKCVVRCEPPESPPGHRDFDTFFACRLRRLFAWSAALGAAHPLHLALAVFMLGEFALFLRYTGRFTHAVDVLTLLPEELLAALRDGKFGEYGTYAAGRWLQLLVDGAGYARQPERARDYLEGNDPATLIEAVLAASSSYSLTTIGLARYYGLVASVPWHLAKGDASAARAAVDGIREIIRRQDKLRGADQQYVVFRLFVGGRDADEEPEEAVYKRFKGGAPQENSLQDRIVSTFFELKRGAPGADELPSWTAVISKLADD